MERLIVLALVGMLVMELLARGAKRMRGTPPEAFRGLERRLQQHAAMLEANRPGSTQGDVETQPARPSSTRMTSAAGGVRRPAGSRGQSSAPAGRRPAATEEYLGSMAHSSNEGRSLMHEDDYHEAWSDGADDSLTGTSGEARATGAIAMALRTLGDPDQMAHGAGAAIVLAEILGPPRAKSTRRPTAPQARWR